jgi:WD40 repeat protein
LLQVFLIISLPAIFLAALAEVNRRWRHHYFDSSVAVSPDGRIVATGISSLPVLLWDARTHRLLATLRGHSRYVSGVAFSPDSRLLASCGSDDTVRIWDVRGGQEIRQIKADQGGVAGLCFSPDGRTLATGGRDASVKLWRVSSGEELTALAGHTKVVKKLAFSPDGTILATVGQYGTARLWDVDSGKFLTLLKPPSGTIEDVAFSPQGILATATSGRNRSQRWQVPSGKLLDELAIEQNESLTSVAFSPEGRTLAAGHFGKVTLWDLATSRRLATFDGHENWVCSLAFSPDGQTLISGATNNSVIAWDLRRGRRSAVLHPHMHRTPWDVLALLVGSVLCWLAVWIYAARRNKRSEACNRKVSPDKTDRCRTAAAT